MTGTHNQQSLIYSGTYRFDVTQTINSAGHLELEAQPFLVGANFQVGSSGTFKGNSPEKYALEVLMYLQNLENTPGLNPQNRNFVSGTYNSDNQRYEGSFSIPVTFSLNPTTGVISYGANPYLL
ncbi:hypothetical protein [Leptolyngbya sp. KIOST-1]|uniref:hypothetical protein n=1 Tax=Leptolyngbya sp. KIOST-1 TaxID=1229172 RepID=UPI0012E08E5F|nr:hypothetical protein [Leptolyngbya sp. KIOST-1]